MAPMCAFMRQRGAHDKKDEVTDRRDSNRRFSDQAGFW